MRCRTPYTAKTAFRLIACLAIAGLCSNSARAATQIGATSHARVGEGQLHAYIGEISLPAGGVWQIHTPEHDNVTGTGDRHLELYLVPTEPPGLRQLGNRMYAAIEERQIQSARWQIQMGYEACRQFAQESQDTGPASIAELAEDKRWKHLAERWNERSWRMGQVTDLIEIDDAGPYVHLVPKVQFKFDPSIPLPSAGKKNVRRVVAEPNRSVLAFELRPFVDDGLHWVLYTDGKCERVSVDPDLLKQHQVTIRPMIRAQIAKVDDAPSTAYKVVLIRGEAAGDRLEFNAYNQVLGQTLGITWGLSGSSEAEYSDLRELVDEARRFAWRPYVSAGNGGVLNVWDKGVQSESPPNNAARNLSTFSVLGGRAAIEETLQMQNLAVSQSVQTETVDVGSLKGVDVKSHPFEKMLNGQQGGQLEMAGVVPPDRFFVFVGKPESISSMLDSGAPFIASAGTALTGNSLKYNLEAKYLERLGMTRDWVDAVLKSGMTSEIALFTPDLFFIDGTDLTLAAKLKQPRLFQSLLAVLGASKLTSQSILELPTASGDPAYLALRNHLLFASTNRSELQLSLDLLEQQGEGSLGASMEFRYMLTQLPVNEQTRIYAYFSDPFVRKLVGPRVKLGQRRRMLAKAKMEALTARVLLARLDGHPKPNSLPDLVSSGHVPQGWESESMTIEANGLVRNEHFGTLPRMRTLREMPLEKVTPEEAEAYRIYVENYSNYWRRFFDPIAIRLDEVGTDELELSAFILPLVDNSIYNGLRMVMADQDDQTELSIPIVEPTPVVQFSANLKEQAWQQVAGEFSSFFARYAGASPAMLDDFGPGLHVAIFDADPIIAIGSGDIFGAFGGNVLRGGGNEMLMIPVALSVLTRPCSIMVETKSPERTARYLRQAALLGISQSRASRDFAVTFHQVDDRDEWVWTMDVFGVVKLRYGVEVVGKYLVIRNVPWSSNDKVISVEPAELNAAMLQANPAACKKQLPGLHAAASDANRRAVMAGLGRLYPFMLTGAKSVEGAAAEHQRLFGFYPAKFDQDQWTWNDMRLTSSDYGEPTRQRQPSFDPDRPFGLMDRIDSLQLNMQFEDDGLRSSIRWRLR